MNVLGKYIGVLADGPDANEGTSYVVVADATKEQALKAANRIFKVKKAELAVRETYLDDEEDDETAFEPYDGCVSAWAVWRPKQKRSAVS